MQTPAVVLDAGETKADRDWFECLLQDFCVHWSDLAGQSTAWPPELRAGLVVVWCAGTCRESLAAVHARCQDICTMIPVVGVSDRVEDCSMVLQAGCCGFLLTREPIRGLRRRLLAAIRGELSLCARSSAVLLGHLGSMPDIVIGSDTVGLFERGKFLDASASR